MRLRKKFNFKRFLNYLKYNQILYGKKYFYFFVVLVLFMFSVQIISLVTKSGRVDYFQSYYIPMFFGLYAISAIIAVGTSFSSLRSSNKASNFLQLPVIVSEKFLAEFLIRIVGFNLLFFPLFWLTFKLATFIYNLFGWANPLKIYQVESLGLFSAFYYVNGLFENISVALSIFSVFCFLFMGASYFKKYAILKTILTFFGLVFFGFVLMVALSHIFFPDYVEGFHIVIFPRRINENLISTHFYAAILGVFSSLFFLPIAFLKLKEKQA